MTMSDSYSKELIRRRAIQRIKDEQDQEDGNNVETEMVGSGPTVVEPKGMLLTLSPQDEDSSKGTFPRDMLQRVSYRIPLVKDTNPGLTTTLPQKKKK
jgi:hypothetical protein